MKYLTNLRMISKKYNKSETINLPIGTLIPIATDHNAKIKISDILPIYLENNKKKIAKSHNSKLP